MGGEWNFIHSLPILRFCKSNCCFFQSRSGQALPRLMAYWITDITKSVPGSAWKLGQAHSLFFALFCGVGRFFPLRLMLFSLNLDFSRACSHKTNAQIFEQIFAGCKAKICRRTGVRQKFLTPQTAKFAGKMCVWPYVNRP